MVASVFADRCDRMPPQLNRDLLRAVAREVASGQSAYEFEDRIAKRYDVCTRTVRNYVAAVLEDYREEDRAIVSRARLQGRFVATSAAGKWIKRSDKLWAEAARLLARARALDIDRNGGVAGATSRLIAHLEMSGRANLDDGMEPLPVDLDQLKAGAVVAIIRGDRRDAAILIKRAEGADSRACDWFDRAQKIAGTYEPAPPGEEARPAASLTTPQRRAKLERLRGLLRDMIAKRGAEGE